MKYHILPIYRQGAKLSQDLRIRIPLGICHQSTASSQRSKPGSHDLKQNLPPHSLLPTPMLVRSLLVSTISSNKVLLPAILKLLNTLATSQMWLFDVKRNIILRTILKRTFYQHFCAGENEREVKNTIKNIKDMGFKGVILTYAREIVVDATEEEKGSGTVQFPPKTTGRAAISFNPNIESWRSGVMETVEMVSENDILALKFTGAGHMVSEALAKGQALPNQMMKALEQICSRALERKVRIFVDAEQQSVQPGIDAVALDLMKKYNHKGTATVYNTYQAYLTIAPSTILDHLRIASGENFTLGVKLVRGAYMKSEPRHIIHKTKEDTDNAYDSITTAILGRRFGDLTETGLGSSKFPSVEMFLATHNKESTLKAYEHYQSQTDTGGRAVPIEFGQLLGMADEVSCNLLQLKLKAERTGNRYVPQVYKCLSWGALSDCISYLVRRAVENRDAVTRNRVERNALRTEMWRRLSIRR
ncbi:FAD-linked oxidoreductase [Polychaeton citri CBS 116435]|uniref:Proline dehydrogenase n=1 Tax=Polychaeton citri CBS 116435 TaxID=1314669 RepID=A0A9P4PYH9_9PEZI|nr:FAD-linked oxidoreductase [Polychaeton citri CBS 116435]